MTVLLYSGLFVYDRILFTEWYSLVAKMVKNLPAMWDTQVQSLGQKDPLEKEVATHSSVLAWKILWTEESGGLQSMRSQKRVGHSLTTKKQQIICMYI